MKLKELKEGLNKFGNVELSEDVSSLKIRVIGEDMDRKVFEAIDAISKVVNKKTKVLSLVNNSKKLEITLKKKGKQTRLYV